MKFSIYLNRLVFVMSDVCSLCGLVSARFWAFVVLFCLVGYPIAVLSESYIAFWGNITKTCLFKL